MYRHILVATDGSALSRRAIRQGVSLAKALGARLTAIAVRAHAMARGYRCAANRHRTMTPRNAAIRISTTARAVDDPAESST
jgi:K+-sensing histidine kinase KdpD